MKKAKVTLAYEGRGRKRCRGNSSKSAEMTANERRNAIRATRALSIIPNNRSIVTRSIAMQMMELEDEGTLYGVDTIQDPVEEMNDDNKPKEQVQLPQQDEQQPQHEQQQEEEQPANQVVPVPVENKEDGEEMLVLDDLPVICNYEEAWPCSNAGYSSGWHSGWDPTNELWEPFGDVKFEPFWDDALWDFKDDDETKKL